MKFSASIRTYPNTSEAQLQKKIKIKNDNNNKKNSCNQISGLVIHTANLFQNALTYYDKLQ